MKVAKFFVEWFCVWICHLCLVAGAANGDVILWDAPVSSTLPRQTIAAGEMASTAMDLTQAAHVEQIYLRLTTPSEYRFTGASSQLSLWLGDEVNSKDRLLYSGPLVTFYGVSEWLPAGRTWLTVEALANSRTFMWLPSTVGTGFHTTAAGQTVQTAGFGSIAIGVVPEPEHVVLLLVCCAAGVFHAWRKSRG